MPQPPPVRMDDAAASASPSGTSPNFSSFVLPNSSSPVLPNVQNTSLAPCSPVPPPISFQSQTSPNQSTSLPAPIAHHSTDNTSHTYSMITRSMNNIYKPKQLHSVSKHPIPPTIEPTCVSQALRDPKWRSDMSDGLTTLMRHHTWDLVLPPPHYNLVGCKWVFRVKRKSDGSVDRFKARLIAKGFHQRPGLDYIDTFSPVVKPATIRTVLTISVMQGWSLRQLDVNNAFLHEKLHVIVYMIQPPGIKDLSNPNHVCRLQKTIYGLKQAPREWYSTLKKTIMVLGFTNSKADSSLFIYNTASVLCFLLVYVDDLIITSSDNVFVSSIIDQLGVAFSLKDMGPLHFFLGMEVIPTTDGLFLSQHKYIHDILCKTNMLGAKEVSTPLSTTTALQLIDGTSSMDNTKFRRVIGGLQYLSLTCPDISFAVNKLSQFMHKPTATHWTAAKRLLHYLKHTIYHGIHIQKNSRSNLINYTDADWAGNYDDRRSTSAYICFLSSNPISWSSKRSSIEAEYKALANAASETIWLLSLFQELGLSLTSPPTLLCDNLGATQLSLNPIQHSPMKHIQIDLHFVRDMAQKGMLKVHHVHNQDQLADLLTKPMSTQRTKRLRTKIGLADDSPILRGRIKDHSTDPASDHSTDSASNPITED